uniref:Uncharacterized protein n=1 Tax=Tetradesmus obliquus TaxID=3088 RepID=A0A383WGG0_TETOB
MLSATCQPDGQWGQLSGTCFPGTCSFSAISVPASGGASFDNAAWLIACGSTAHGSWCTSSTACSRAPDLVAQGPLLHSVTQQAPGRTWKARALQCRQLAVVAVAVEVAVEVGAEAPQLDHAQTLPACRAL